MAVDVALLHFQGLGLPLPGADATDLLRRSLSNGHLLALNYHEINNHVSTDCYTTSDVFLNGVLGTAVLI